MTKGGHTSPASIYSLTLQCQRWCTVHSFNSSCAASLSALWSIRHLRQLYITPPSWEAVGI